MLCITKYIQLSVASGFNWTVSNHSNPVNILHLKNVHRWSLCCISLNIYNSLGKKPNPRPSWASLYSYKLKTCNLMSLKMKTLCGADCWYYSSWQCIGHLADCAFAVSRLCAALASCQFISRLFAYAEQARQSVPDHFIVVTLMEKCPTLMKHYSI